MLQIRKENSMKTDFRKQYLNKNKSFKTAKKNSKAPKLKECKTKKYMRFNIAMPCIYTNRGYVQNSEKNCILNWFHTFAMH